MPREQQLNVVLTVSGIQGLLGKNLITSYIYIPAHDQFTGSALYVYRQFHAIIHYIYICIAFSSLHSLGEEME